MDYIKYIEDVLDKYKKYTLLVHQNEILPSAINEAMAKYSYVQMGLIAEYNRKKNELYEVKKEYDYFYSEKYSEVRKKMMNELETKSAKIGQKEIEYEMKVIYKKEMQLLEDKVYYAEEEVAYLNRLLGSWDNFAKMLLGLSNNMRSEMYTLHLQDQVGDTTNKVRRGREEVE